MQTKNSSTRQISFSDNFFQSCAVAVFIIDKFHHVIYWNEACEKLTNISARDMIGTNNHWMGFYNEMRPCLSDLVLLDELDKVSSYYPVSGKSILKSGGWHAEGWFPGLGGKKRYLIFDAAPVYDNQKNVIAAIETLQDITERKNLEEQNERLISELRDALASIKMLKGLIPICATCKKIRDDQGYWNKLETFIETHSDVEFSHSMCPACEETFYQDYEKIK